MSTINEIIARSETLAQGRNTDPTASPVIDSGTMTAESIFPHALRYCTAEMLATGENLQNSAINHTIALVAGVGTLPDAVIREFLRSDSHLPTVPMSSWIDYPDFNRAKFTSLLKYYSANNGSFYYSDTAASSIVLNAPSVAVMPSDPDAAVPLSGKLVDNIVATIAAVLTGELSFAALTKERF